MKELIGRLFKREMSADELTARYLEQGQALSKNYNLSKLLELDRADEGLVSRLCAVKILQERMSADSDTIRRYDEQPFRLMISMPLFLDKVAQARMRYEQSQPVLEELQGQVAGFIEEYYSPETTNKAYTLRLAVNMLFNQGNLHAMADRTNNRQANVMLESWADVWKRRIHESA